MTPDDEAACITLWQDGGVPTHLRKYVLTD
jgi:hypothetical protein